MLKDSGTGSTDAAASRIPSSRDSSDPLASVPDNESPLEQLHLPENPLRLIASQIQSLVYREQYPGFERSLQSVAAHIPAYIPEKSFSFHEGRVQVVLRAAWEWSEERLDSLKAALEPHSEYPIDIHWEINPDAVVKKRTPRTPTAAEKISTSGNGSLSTARVPSLDRLRREVRSSAPEGVAVLRTTLYSSPLGKQRLNFATVRVHSENGLGDSLQEWALELEAKYGIGIIPEQVDTPAELKKSLTRIAEPDGLVRSAGAVRSLMLSLHGLPCPNGTTDCGTPVIPRNLVHLEDEPALSIDPQGARDLDDIVHAYDPRPDGSIRLHVTFANAAWMVRKGSEMDEYVSRAGETVYGRFSALPLYGTDLSYGELSLLQGQPRYGFTVQMDIDRKGQILNGNVVQSRVVNHFQLSFARSQGILDGVPDPAALHLERLVAPAQRLRAARLGRSFLKLEDGSTRSSMTSYGMVQEFMIAARQTVAEYCSRNKIPIPYKVHTHPSREVRRALLKEVQAKGYNAAMGREFSQNTAFSRLIVDMYNNRDIRQMYRMLDVYRGRSRFDATQRPHDGLGVPGYTEPKARHQAGLIVQRQLERYENGNTPLSQSSIRKLQGSINANRRNMAEKEYLYFVYEGLYEALKDPAAVHRATVVRSTPGGVLVQVPAFRWRYAALMVPRLSENAPPAVGSKLLVQTEGHSQEIRRMVVRPVT